MESPIGLLKIKVIRGMNLVVMDFTSSDPYVVISIGDQDVQTGHVYDTCNPYWSDEDELTLGVYDLDTPIILKVYDKDTFKGDDFMGESRIDIIPYLEYVKAGLAPLSTGSIVGKIDPSEQNCLHETSYILWKDGQLVQKMILRLNNVLTGEVEIQVRWEEVSGGKGLTS
ncbi:protein C2-DOMAIN ABA-RELATED 7-like [Silene latifolia]|uniref:protein C2-DOMAIN ABA-RELATED 7-like n=1 Tax=Silene latifolia TaxID=37657 RepID=UPI003D783D2F